MIYLPWIAFLIAVLWMIRQGDKAKEEYLQRKANQKMVAEVKARLEEIKAEVEASTEELKAAMVAQRPEETERERRAKIMRGLGRSTRERPIEELAEMFGNTGEQGRSEWKM
jgi:hypothetical protein